MKSTEFLGREVEVKIDRKLGSKHPKWGFIYELNYGYIENVISGDGEELDAYILGVEYPVESFKGVCIAVLKRLKEDDDKLIVAPKGVDFTEEEIRNLINFQEQWFESIIVRNNIL